MKLHHLFVFSALLGGAMCSDARAELIDLTTVTGKTYRQCRVVRMDPDGVLFRHANGAGKVLFQNMTKPLREHFGFDPAKLKAHEAKVKADKANERKIAEERAREVMKQREEAVERALDHQALYALQQVAALAQANQGYNLGNVVSLGTTFGSGDYFRPASNRRNSLKWTLSNVGYWGSGIAYGGVGNFGYGGGYGFGGGYGLGGCYNGGFTPRPFFAVPGVGPNYVPAAACPPRVIHGSGVIPRR